MGMEVKAWHIAAFSIAGVAFVMGVVLLLVYCWCKPRRELRNRSKPPSTRLLATDHVVNDIAEAPAFMEEGKEKTNPIFNKRLSTFSSSSSMGERDASIANGTDRAASGVGSTSKQEPPSIDTSAAKPAHSRSDLQQQQQQQPQLLPVTEDASSTTTTETHNTSSTSASEPIHSSPTAKHQQESTRHKAA